MTTIASGMWTRHFWAASRKGSPLKVTTSARKAFKCVMSIFRIVMCAGVLPRGHDDRRSGMNQRRAGCDSFMMRAMMNDATSANMMGCAAYSATASVWSVRPAATADTTREPGAAIMIPPAINARPLTKAADVPINCGGTTSAALLNVSICDALAKPNRKLSAIAKGIDTDGRYSNAPALASWTAMPITMGILRRSILSESAGTTRQPAARPSQRSEELNAPVAGEAPRISMSLGVQTTPAASMLPNNAAQINADNHTCAILITCSSASSTECTNVPKPPAPVDSTGFGFLRKKKARIDSAIPATPTMLNSSRHGIAFSPSCSALTENAEDSDAQNWTSPNMKLKRDMTNHWPPMYPAPTKPVHAPTAMTNWEASSVP